MNEKSTALAITPTVRVKRGIAPERNPAEEEEQPGRAGARTSRLITSWFFSVALLKIVTGR